MLIDTGSSPSWVQCEGCQSCFPLNGSGNFKYTQSQSFRRLPCNNSLCTPKLCDEQGYCRYNAKYLRSSSQGAVLTDTFTFPTNSRTTTAKYPNLAFGCGLTNENLSFGKDNNKIAGIMGLGLEKKNSILVQLEYQTKRRFSYWLSQLDTPTSLHFGDDARIKGTIRTVQGTRLVPGSSNYFAREVLGISIGNTSLKINPEVFRLKQDGTGGFVMDTGSPYSCIVQNASKILRAEMVKYFMVHHRMNPVQPTGKFDQCYNLMSSAKYVIPSMTFHFKEANLVLKPDVVFRSFSDPRTCLAMIRVNELGPNILGAFQQTNHRFVFDGGRYMIAFAPENCA